MKATHKQTDTVSSKNPIDEAAAIRKMSFVSVAGNAVLSGFKFFAGVTGNSGAMISDSIHSFSDVITTVIAWIGVKVSKKEADSAHPYIKDNEEMTPIGVYLATLIFQGGFPEESEAQKKMNDIDRAVENQSLYQCIQEKAKKILDLSNPFEEQMYYDLMNMAKIRCCTPYVSPEEYDRMVRFTESAIANDTTETVKRHAARAMTPTAMPWAERERHLHGALWHALLQ